jgi:Xaa-Pro dipeptidase
MSRVSSLAQRLAESGADVFLAWSINNLGYLHGFYENAHERLMTLAVHKSGRSALIAPALSEAQARRAGIQDVLPWTDNDDPLPLVSNLLGEWQADAGMVLLDNDMPAHMVLRIQRALPHARFSLGQDVMAQLRSVKDEDELSLMRHAGSIVDEVYRLALEWIQPGMTELQVEHWLREQIRQRGATPTFCTVAFGAGSAEPHHINTDAKLEHGTLVLIDFGCDYKRYQSDITRCFHCGPAPERAKEIYGIVYRAHQAARQAIRPGVEAQELDRIARKIISDAGHGPAFCHRLGHGVGMDVHEDPNIVEGNAHRLVSGNCFSIEPGIYYPGELGIRIENLVAVTGHGHESLNEEPCCDLQEV